MNYNAFFTSELTKLKDDGNYREFAELERRRGAFPTAICHNGPGDVTIWCSNDYLGMGQHPKVLAAMHDALDRTGAGAGGTRNISGTTHDHVLLEAELADLHGKEDALLFTSGYVSNWAALGTLAAKIPNCVVLSDALNHASMIEGIRHSRAERVIWKHNDLADLEEKLAVLPADQPKLIAFESVYSMDGDIAPIKEICDLADRYRPLRRDDLSRRGACSRSVRCAWRRYRRTRRADGPIDRDRRHFGQGLWCDGRLHRSIDRVM